MTSLKQHRSRRITSPKRHQKKHSKIKKNSHRSIESDHHGRHKFKKRTRISPPTAKEIEEREYVLFSLKVTDEILTEHMYKDEEIIYLLRHHYVTNKFRLNQDKLLQTIGKLCIEMNIPFNQQLVDFLNNSFVCGDPPNNQLIRIPDPVPPIAPASNNNVKDVATRCTTPVQPFARTVNHFYSTSNEVPNAFVFQEEFVVGPWQKWPLYSNMDFRYNWPDNNGDTPVKLYPYIKGSLKLAKTPDCAACSFYRNNIGQPLIFGNVYMDKGVIYLTKSDDLSVQDDKYLQLSLNITDEIIKKGLYSYDEMVEVIRKYYWENKHTIDKEKLLATLTKLCTKLNIPSDAGLFKSIRKDISKFPAHPPSSAKMVQVDLITASSPIKNSASKVEKTVSILEQPMQDRTLFIAKSSSLILDTVKNKCVSFPSENSTKELYKRNDNDLDKQSCTLKSAMSEPVTSLTTDSSDQWNKSLVKSMSDLNAVRAVFNDATATDCEKTSSGRDISLSITEATHKRDVNLVFVHYLSCLEPKTVQTKEFSTQAERNAKMSISVSMETNVTSFIHGSIQNLTFQLNNALSQSSRSNRSSFGCNYNISYAKYNNYDMFPVSGCDDDKLSTAIIPPLKLKYIDKIMDGYRNPARMSHFYPSTGTQVSASDFSMTRHSTHLLPESDFPTDTCSKEHVIDAYPGDYHALEIYKPTDYPEDGYCKIKPESYLFNLGTY